MDPEQHDPRPRPSFTIGSDSESATTTSFEAIKVQRLPKIESVREFRQGFIGSSSRQPTPTPSPQQNLFSPPQKFTARQKLTFAIFALVELFSAMLISLQAPFYPFEASAKGASATEYSLVFGIFELTVFISSPILRSFNFPPKLMFTSGILLTSLSAVAFGFLDKIDERTLFILMSVLVRIFEAIGESAFITSSFVIIAKEFPNSVANSFATLETLYGLGLILGPLAGGLLYQIGGYSLPFVLIGGLLFTSGVLTALFLPNSQQLTPPTTNGFKMFSLLTLPPLALMSFSIFSASLSSSYLNATLEPHLRLFSLSPFSVGAVIIISGTFYSISAPFYGYICDKANHSLKCINIIGCILIIIGFSLIGPLPLLPLQLSLWSVIIGQVIHGLGLGAVLVSSFFEGLRGALTVLPDTVETYSTVSGIWTSMFALGGFGGAFISGGLFDLVGFAWGSFAVVGLMAVVGGVVMVSLCLGDDDDEEEETREGLVTSYGSIVLE